MRYGIWAMQGLRMKRELAMLGGKGIWEEEGEG